MVPFPAVAGVFHLCATTVRVRVYRKNLKTRVGQKPFLLRKDGMLPADFSQPAEPGMKRGKPLRTRGASPVLARFAGRKLAAAVRLASFTRKAES